MEKPQLLTTTHCVFKIQIRSLSRKILEIYVSKKDTIRSIKNKLTMIMGYRYYQLTLMIPYIGHLKDSCTVHDYKINENSIIYFIIRKGIYEFNIFPIPTYSISINKLTGEMFKILVGPNYKIFDIKKIIHEQEGIPLLVQTIIFKKEKKELQNHKTLFEYNIKENSILYLVIRFERLGKK